MKVLALLGSPRKKGNTSLLLNEYLRGIEAANKNAEITKVYLQEKYISNCTACEICRKITIGQCAIADDMLELYPLFCQADLVIYATPIYWWSISAQLKTFMDRCYAINTSEDSFSGKKVALLMTYGGELPNKGPALIKATFEEICEYKEMQLIHVYSVCTDDYMPVAENAKALKEIYDLGMSLTIGTKIRNLFKKIEYYDGFFYKDVLLELIHRKAEAIPILLEVLEKVKEDPKKFIEDIRETYYSSHVYAVYILSQLRVREVYPVMIDLFSLPGNIPHILFLDTISEAAGRMLASVCGNDITPIKNLIDNPLVSEYVRAQGLRALTILYLAGAIERESLLEYYKKFLDTSSPATNKLIITEIVYLCTYIHPEELYKDIKKAFEANMVDLDLVSSDSIDCALKSDKKALLEASRKEIHLQFINDALKELEQKPCFSPKYMKLK